MFYFNWRDAQEQLNFDWFHAFCFLNVGLNWKTKKVRFIVMTLFLCNHRVDDFLLNMPLLSNRVWRFLLNNFKTSSIDFCFLKFLTKILKITDLRSKVSLSFLAFVSFVRSYFYRCFHLSSTWKILRLTPRKKFTSAENQLLWMKH